MDEILRDATAAIMDYPYSFMYRNEVQHAFRALEKGIKERTEETDTLVISIPADEVPDKKLKLLPLPVTSGEDRDGMQIVSFDWFTLPEKRTGFADVAGGFISALVKGLNGLPEAKLPTESEIDEVKQNYSLGMKLRVLKMADDYGLSEGTIVTVDFVDDIGQIHVKESGLALIQGLDKFEVVE